LIEDDSVPLKITQDDFKQASQVKISEDSQGFNAMSLFAYSGAEGDHFSNAFVNKQQKKESRILSLFTSEDAENESPKSCN